MLSDAPLTRQVMRRNPHSEMGQDWLWLPCIALAVLAGNWLFAVPWAIAGHQSISLIGAGALALASLRLPQVKIIALMVLISAGLLAGQSITMALGEALTACVAVLVLDRLQKRVTDTNPLSRPRDLWQVLVAALAMAVANALAVMVITNTTEAASLALHMLSECAGVLLFLPLMLAIRTSVGLQFHIPVLVESGLMYVQVLALTCAAFWTDGLPLAFLPIPALALMAARLPLLQVCLSLVLTGIITISGTVHGHGSFAELLQPWQVISTQLYLIAIGSATLLLAAVVRHANVSQIKILNREALYRSIVEDQTELICRFDQDGTISFANEAFCDFFSLSQREMRRCRIDALPKPDIGQALLDASTDISPTRFAVQLKQRHQQAASGEAIWIDWSLRGIFDNDLHLHEIQVVGRDVSATMNLQEDLGQALEQAQSAAAAKDQFLANMSHEMRTPMNGIIGMTDIMLGDQCSEDQREQLAIIQRSAASLLDVINDVLDFAKISNNQQELNIVQFDILELIDDIGSILYPSCMAKNIRLHSYAPAGMPHLLRGDQGRLRQIITNLAGNAVKFTENGQVSITLNWTRSLDDQCRFQIEIADTGVGIPADKLDLIFEKFRQVDESHSRQYQGTGLGLTISRELATALGGNISVTSTVGEGSCFTLNIPMSAESIAPAPEACGQRVVLLGADRDVHRTLIDTLKDYRLTIIEAAHASEVLEDLQADPRLLLICCGNMAATLLDDFVSEYPDRKVRSILVGNDSLHPPRHRADAQLNEPIALTRLHQVISEFVAQKDRSTTGILLDHTKIAPLQRSLRVLTVEDNLINQKVIVSLLRKMGCKVLTASNGKQALEILEQEKVDCILMDCQMPIMDGYEATRAIREAEGPGEHMPIIAVTAGAFPGDRERCLNCGMDQFLTKPVRMASLRDAFAQQGLGFIAE